MIKEFFIYFYLGLVKGLFLFFGTFPLQTKTVFLSAFGDNAFFIATELARSSKHPLIFLNKSQCRLDFRTVSSEQKKIIQFDTPNPIAQCRSIYHLATAKYIFVDSYAGILSAARFRPGVKCIQLWHAIGAVKRFGWSDPATLRRSKRAQQRFQEVYEKFHFLPVGSEQMARLFAEAFRLDMTRFLYTGVPQTDFYFNEEAKAEGLCRVLTKYPVLRGKKCILYAPTFRKDELAQMRLALKIDDLLQKLDDTCVLLIRLHPSVRKALELPVNSRMILVSDYPSVHDLLVASDVLITDYSSISFEFAFLRKKMIFFPYDFKRYAARQGVWAAHDLYFPGPVASSTEEVIEHLLDPTVDFEKLDRFRTHWTSFCKGHSTQNLISAIYDKKDL